MANIIDDLSTSRLNKLWRAKILYNRIKSGLPKDSSLKSSHDNPNIVHKNPIDNHKEKLKRELSLKNQDNGLPKDTPILIDVSKGKSSINALKIHQKLKAYNNRNQVIIYNLTSNGSYKYIVLQNRPSEIQFNGETSWATIKSMGRNTPMYHYTGAEDILQFNISWYCSDANNPNEVINKCRLLESWTKANSYISGPPILKIQWGSSGIFDNHKYILTSATYTLKNFQNGHIDRSSSNSKFIDTKLLPMVATQELIFKRVSGTNLGYGDFIDSNTTDKTNGIVK